MCISFLNIHRTPFFMPHRSHACLMTNISKSYTRYHIFCVRVCISFLNIHRTPSTMRARGSPTSSLMFSRTYFLEYALLFSHFLKYEKTCSRKYETKDGRDPCAHVRRCSVHIFSQSLLCFRFSSAKYVCVCAHICVYI